MRRVLRAHRTHLVAAILQGCGFGISSFSLGRSSTGTSLAEEEATGSDADARPTNVSVTKSNPLEAYIAVGGTIKRCWFNAADPLLPKHVYRADVSPGGGTVKITVHQRAKLGRAATSSPQYLLPKDLSRGIRQLTDQEFDRLLAAVLTEQKRRGKKLSVSHKASRKSPIQEFGPPLTLAKLNAVRAAFKAGVPPSRIARQFGISRADVREALASGTSKRCTASCDNGERSWPHRSPLRRSGQCRSGQ